MELAARFNHDVAGQQNDIRIATNLAQLGAAFELFAEYLGDVWPDWREAARSYVEVDLVNLRGEMLDEAREQQASEVFLRALSDLIRFDQVRIEGLSGHPTAEHKPLVGRVAGPRGAWNSHVGAGSADERLEICTSLALGEVNTCLRQQGKTNLQVSEGALLQQLREDGKVLDRNGEPFQSGGLSTHRVRLDGDRQVRVFVISRSALLDD